jgi:hypothetical protein
MYFLLLLLQQLLLLQHQLSMPLAQQGAAAGARLQDPQVLLCLHTQLTSFCLFPWACSSVLCRLLPLTLRL